MIIYNELKSYFIDTKMLEEGQFEVYYQILISKESLKASDIVNRVTLNRSYVYSILTYLKKEGLIYSTSGPPAKYAANSPKGFIKKQKDFLEEFIAFVERVVEPTLETSIFLTKQQQTYLLDSREALISRLLIELKKCKNRLHIQAPIIFLKEIEKQLNEAIERLGFKYDKEQHPEINLSVIISTYRSKEKLDIEHSVQTNSKIYTMIFVLDNTTFVFNVTHEIQDMPFGMGLMIEDDEHISNSYAHQLTHLFTDELYKNPPPFSIDDIPKAIRDDEEFIKTIEILIDRNWHIFKERIVENDHLNYVEFITPEESNIPDLKEAGLNYIQIKTKDSAAIKKILDRSFIEMKKNIVEALDREVKAGILNVEYLEYEEEVNGFDCRIYEPKITAPKNAKWKKQYGYPELKETMSSRSFVFNYYNRAVVTVWAAMRKNSEEIMKLLYETHKE